LLDLEEVFINTSHKYDVVLENRGDIDVVFNLIESTSLFGPFFSFEPSSGFLKVGEEVKINVSFTPTILGDVHEEFAWLLGVIFFN
jgi:hypothetical protein